MENIVHFLKNSPFIFSEREGGREGWREDGIDVKSKFSLLIFSLKLAGKYVDIVPGEGLAN